MSELAEENEGLARRDHLASDRHRPPRLRRGHRSSSPRSSSTTFTASPSASGCASSRSCERSAQAGQAGAPPGAARRGDHHGCRHRRHGDRHARRPPGREGHSSPIVQRVSAGASRPAPMISSRAPLIVRRRSWASASRSSLSVLLPSLRVRTDPAGRCDATQKQASAPSVGPAASSSARRSPSASASLLFLHRHLRPPRWRNVVDPRLAGLGALLTFLGVASAVGHVRPTGGRFIGAPFEKLFGTAGQFARDNAARSPRRTASHGFGAHDRRRPDQRGGRCSSASFRDTFGRRQLDNARVTADYIVLDDASFQPFPPDVAGRLSAIPELSAVSPFRSIRGEVSEVRRATRVQRRQPDGSSPSCSTSTSSTDRSYDSRDADSVCMVYSDPAESEDLGVGDTVDTGHVAERRGQSTLTGRGHVFDDNSLTGNWLISIVDARAGVDPDASSSTSDRGRQDRRRRRLPDAARAAIDAALGPSSPSRRCRPTASSVKTSQEARSTRSCSTSSRCCSLMAIVFSFIGIADHDRPLGLRAHARDRPAAGDRDEPPQAPQSRCAGRR